MKKYNPYLFHTYRALKYTDYTSSIAKVCSLYHSYNNPPLVRNDALHYYTSHNTCNHNLYHNNLLEFHKNDMTYISAKTRNLHQNYSILFRGYICFYMYHNTPSSCNQKSNSSILYEVRMNLICSLPSMDNLHLNHNTQHMQM